MANVNKLAVYQFALSTFRTIAAFSGLVIIQMTAAGRRMHKQVSAEK